MECSHIYPFPKDPSNLFVGSYFFTIFVKKNMMMLFKVTLRGMTIGPNAYGISYVVAECPTSAYKKVKEFLDTNDLGFSRDRELHSIELIADSYRHTAGTLLHI